MIGVVLWCDNVATKAVIWCEDQGDLAFFNAEPNSENHRIGFDAGDLVQFEMFFDPSTSTRRARDLHLMIEKGGAALPKVLRDAASPPEELVRQVVPFAPVKQTSSIVMRGMVAASER